MADVITQVDGRPLRLTNLDKVLYPGGVTKGEVIAYHRAIAPVLLPHLAGRPVTRVRHPQGATAAGFFEKNLPTGTPGWVHVHHVVGAHEDVTYPLVDDLATLLWLANLAALELHTPQWRVAPGTDSTTVDGELPVDQVVVDLDPGPGIDMPVIATAALLVAGALAEDGLVGHAKTSGSKGIQVYAAVEPTPASRAVAWARGLGARLVAAHPDLFVTDIAASARPGRILVDVNQNLPGRTTVSPYSLRARERPTVSTPLTWEEVEDATAGAPCSFTADEVLLRVERQGDLWRPLLEGRRGRLPG